jgi:hypothetical protein
MGLETGTYISSLNSSNPTTGDNKTEGDDHIRLIKATLLATFPNVTGAVTATHTQLNAAATAATGSVSFNGRDSSARTTTGDFGTYTEVFDVGSNFNASSGVFTAPVAGKYMFAYIAGGYASSTGYAEIHLQINGSSGYSANICASLSTLSNYVGGSAVISMAANDTAKMNLSSYSGTGATVYVRSFSGFLIAGT